MFFGADAASILFGLLCRILFFLCFPRLQTTAIHQPTNKQERNKRSANKQVRFLFLCLIHPKPCKIKPSRVNQKITYFVYLPWGIELKCTNNQQTYKQSRKTNTSKAKQSKAKQSKASNAKQSKAKQSKAKRSKAKQSKAKQSKAKQSKAKQSVLNLEPR